MAPPNPGAIDGPSGSSSTTSPSSQLSFETARSFDSPPSLPNADAPHTYYRSIKPLPYELQEHCAIYLEEGLYCQALNFLSSLVTASAATAIPQPALIPPPHFLRLISTLSVQPNLTTRAKSNDRLQASILAHRYLRLVLRHTGPIQSEMSEAFTYDGVGGRTTGRRRTTSLSPLKERSNIIENELANSASLFSLAESFWHVIGWAFNCSILYPKRWDCWQAWLEYMIEVLEVDWTIHRGDDTLEQSLLVQYIIAGGGQIDSGRKILRAIFANGQTTSTGEFREIWPHETKSLQRREDEIKNAEKAIDIEADDYGDYLSDNNSTTRASTQSPKSTRSSTFLVPPASPSFVLGGPSALHLRLRLLSLLTTAAATHPTSLGHPPTTSASNDIEPLLSHLAPHLLSFPPLAFSHLLSPPTLRPLPPNTASILLQYLLHRTNLIEPAAPEPESFELTQQTLEESYLPWAAGAGGVMGNARVSVLVEGLVRLLERFGGGVEVGQGFVGALEEGVCKREEKASGGGSGRRGRKRKSGDGSSGGRVEEDAEAEAWETLRGSGARLRSWVKG